MKSQCTNKYLVEKWSAYEYPGEYISIFHGQADNQQKKTFGYSVYIF